MTARVAVLVGSVRGGSINQQLADGLALLGHPKLRFDRVTIDTLPMYNDDLWQDPPSAVVEFKQTIRRADAVLLVTPEYNRSIPPLMKNAIDWGTRPRGDSVWSGMPLSIIGASIGVIGTAAAQAHLKSVMVALDSFVMGQPEVYFAYRPEYFGADGRVIDPSVAAFLEKYLDAFSRMIDRVGKRQ